MMDRFVCHLLFLHQVNQKRAKLSPSLPSYAQRDIFEEKVQILNIIWVRVQVQFLFYGLKFGFGGGERTEWSLFGFGSYFGQNIPKHCFKFHHFRMFGKFKVVPTYICFKVLI